MTNPVQPIPNELRGAIPMLAVCDAPAAIEFYKRAFGAVEILRLVDPAGNIVHAELKIGEALVMMAEEDPAFNKSPKTLGGSSVILLVYVEDVDKVGARAVAAGAKEVFPIKDQFYGDRSGRFQDPYGHLWILSTHREDVSIEELQKRFTEMCEGS